MSAFVTGITLGNVPTGSIPVGQNRTITATVTPACAANKTVSWSSANTNVATINNGGVITARAGGSTMITARATDGSNVSRSFCLAVATQVFATGVTIGNRPTVSMSIGHTTTVTATVTPANTTIKTVNWTSSNTGVATIDQCSGFVTARAAGSAMITARVMDGSNVSHSFCLAVAAGQIPVTGVSIPFNCTNMSGNQTLALCATISPSNATNRAVTWSSSNNLVATVSQMGVVKAVAGGKGYAIITVTTADGNKTATCFIMVSNPGVVSGNVELLTNEQVKAIHDVIGPGRSSQQLIDLWTGEKLNVSWEPNLGTYHTDFTPTHSNDVAIFKKIVESRADEKGKVDWEHIYQNDLLCPNWLWDARPGILILNVHGCMRHIAVGYHLYPHGSRMGSNPGQPFRNATNGNSSPWTIGGHMCMYYSNSTGGTASQERQEERRNMAREAHKIGNL